MHDEISEIIRFVGYTEFAGCAGSPPRLPEPIRKELERIQKLEGEPYGLVFAVRDLYETV